jgi:hypothetical protein
LIFPGEAAVRRLAAASLILLSLFLTSCGNVFFRGAILTTQQSVSGTVSLVQLTAVFDHGSSITVTAVTFLGPNGASSVNFCGDQRSQFPMNQFVKANFSPGNTCSTLILVIVV